MSLWRDSTSFEPLLPIGIYDIEIKEILCYPDKKFSRIGGNF